MRTFSIHYTARPLDTRVTSLTIRDGQKLDAYHVYTRTDVLEWRHDNDPDRSYHVTCVRGTPRSCTCQGFRRWGKCKHVAVSGVLAAKGRV